MKSTGKIQFPDDSNPWKVFPCIEQICLSKSLKDRGDHVLTLAFTTEPGDLEITRIELAPSPSSPALPPGGGCGPDKMPLRCAVPWFLDSSAAGTGRAWVVGPTDHLKVTY